MTDPYARIPKGLRLYLRKLWLATMLGISIINALEELQQARTLLTEIRIHRALVRARRHKGAA